MNHSLWDEEREGHSHGADANAERGDGFDLLGIGKEGFHFGGGLDGVGGYIFSVSDGYFANVFRAYGNGGSD